MTHIRFEFRKAGRYNGADVPPQGSRLPGRAVKCLMEGFSVLILLGSVAWAQSPPVTSIREALEDRDGDRIPDRRGQTVTVRGVITTDPRLINDRKESRANLQDETGGVRLYARDQTLHSLGLERGNLVEVQGKVEHYKGIEEILVKDVRKIGEADLPNPVHVHAADLNGETHSGQLVLLSGELVVPQDFTNNKRGLVVRDTSGEIRLYLPDRFFRNPEFTEQLLAGGRIEVVGIAEQYDTTPPFDSGYRVSLRDLADLHFAPRPPIVLIASIAGGICFLGALLYMEARRRSRRRHARELRESELKFRLLFRSNPQPMWMCDLGSLRILEVNDAAVRRYGYSREAFLAMRITDLSPAEEVPRLMKTLEQRCDFEESGEWRHRGSNGETLDVRIACHTLSYAERNVALVVVEDITKRKAAEAKLRLYGQIFTHTNEAIVVMGPDGGVVEQNGAHRVLLGFSDEELLGRTPALAMGDEAFSRVSPELLQNGSHRGEIACRNRNGAKLDIDLSAFTVRNEWGEVVCHVALKRDITERKRAESEAKKRATFLNALIENSPLAIVVMDEAQRVEMCNPAFTRLFQYAPPEIRGAYLDDLIADPEKAAEASEITRKGQSQVVHATTKRRRKDGRLVDVELYGLPLIVDGRLIGSCGLYLDVTERNRLEQELHQAQKMEAVGRLAGGVAHDFNNLLGVIIGYSDIVLDRLDSTDPLRKKIEEIRKAGGRAASLTTQLLAFSRKQVLEPRVLSLNSVVADIERMLQRLIGEDIDLACALDPAVGHIKADRGQIEQVIMNLAVNARDAMPRGGKLTIETANANLDESYLRQHPYVRPGPHVMLAVSDTGIGMDAETQAHIFEPFFTTKPTGEGTGLGLATVYGIVKQSGGYIWAYSEPGKGATFKVYLPRVDVVVKKEEEAKTQLEQFRGNEIILFVEDAPSLRQMACEYLRSAGYTVLEAGNGDEALSVCAQHGGPVDLLVTDVVMPGMSGRDLALRLSSLRPEMKVFYVSGYTGEALGRHGVLDPGIAFLQKPFSPADLVVKVRNILNTESVAG